jgi:cell division transport system permease protein
MLSRLTYTLRETWASFQRNVTLTVAAIITSAVSLLIFGLTLLIQHGFDNLLTKWEGGIEMIVYVTAQASDEQRDVIASALDQQQGVVIQSYRYCDVECSLAEADRVLAGDPTSRELLDETTIPTQFKVVPNEGTEVDTLRALKASYAELPNVYSVELAEDQIDLIAKLKGFAGLYTTGLAIALMFAAVLLIWNTIRTAMFARRREIEVMKLVGATDWFIRVPFMLEGLIQGLIGAVVACGGLWFVNNRWTAGVATFPVDSGFSAMVVSGNRLSVVMLFILGIGALVGMIGSGIAASRFLDV